MATGFQGLGVGSIIGGTIMLVIAFVALGQTIPAIQMGLHNVTHYDNGTIGGTLSRGLPFGSMYGSTGIVILALMGAVLLAVMAYFGFKAGKGR